MKNGINLFLLTLVLILSSCLQLTPPSSTDQADSGSGTNTQADILPPKVEILNYKAFQNSLLSSMNLPSDALAAVQEEADSLQVDLSTYTEFNQNNMVKVAYVACNQFMATNPFNISPTDPQYREKTVNALMNHFMSHLNPSSLAVQDIRAQLLAVYALNVYPNQVIASRAVCAFTVANPYVTMSDNLCDAVPDSCL